MRDSKIAISKQKIVEITKAAMNGIRYFKHIVLCVEKFIQKVTIMFKFMQFCFSAINLSNCLLSMFWIQLWDRESNNTKKKMFSDHDLLETWSILLKMLLLVQKKTRLAISILVIHRKFQLKIVRVINLWRTHSVFEPNVVETLLRHCQTIGLEVDVETVEMKVKGDRADLTIYTKDVKKSKKATPRTPPLRDDFNDSFVSLFSIWVKKELFFNNLNVTLLSLNNYLIQASRTSQTSNLSDVCPLNSISEKEIHTRLQQFFPQWATVIEKDFNKFVSIFNVSLQERVDREKASQGANISVSLILLISKHSIF